MIEQYCLKKMKEEKITLDCVTEIMGNKLALRLVESVRYFIYLRSR
jgi:hypothetical protein